MNVGYIPELPCEEGLHEWSNEDVEQFIKERNIKCHPLYYNEFGEFDVKKRLGCIGCPLASKKKRRQMFIEYPKMLKLWIKNYDIYLKNHQQIFHL